VKMSPWAPDDAVREPHLLRKRGLEGGLKQALAPSVSRQAEPTSSGEQWPRVLTYDNVYT